MCHLSISQNLFYEARASDSLVLECFKFDEIFENVVFRKEFLVNDKEFCIKGISKEAFTNAYFLKRKTPMVYFLNDTLVSENINDVYMYRKDSALVHKKTNRLLVDNDTIRHVYLGDIGGYILIGFKMGWYGGVFIYDKNNFQKLDLVLPFVSIINPNKKSILSFDVHDRYISPRGRFELFQLVEEDMQLVSDVVFFAEKENNWIAIMPFFISEKKVLFIYQMLDSKGNNVRNSRFFAELTWE